MTKAKEALDYYVAEGIFSDKYNVGLDDGDKSGFWDELRESHSKTIIKALELLDKVERGGDESDEFVQDYLDHVSKKNLTDKYILIKKDTK